jgi:Leucine-rich repeat (LRR) protein
MIPYSLLIGFLGYLGVVSPLEGTLPTEMGNLSSLTRLDLARLSNLRGSLPSQFVNLTSLSEFTFVHCFYDEIQFPIFLSSLPPFLEKLELLSINFKGSIPKEIGSFQRLTHLSLIEMSLTGSLPSEIGLMTELQSLQLDSISSLDGMIPSELGQLTHLTSLDIECTSFTMPIPSEVSSLPGLKISLIGC